MKRIRALISFYLGFLPAGWALTMIGIFIFHQQYSVHGWSTFIYLFWFKIISLSLIWYMMDRYRKQVYYYYFNLGLSKTLLWGFTLGIDFGLFLLLIIATAPGI